MYQLVNTKIKSSLIHCEPLFTCGFGTVCKMQWFITQKESLKSELNMNEEQKKERLRKAKVKALKKTYENYAVLKEDKELVKPGPNQTGGVPRIYNVTNILNSKKFGITKKNINGHKNSAEARNETAYWKDVLKEKLKPKGSAETSVADERQTKQNLLELKNRFVAMFIFVNSFWLVALLGVSIFAENYGIDTVGLFCDGYEAKNGTKEECDDLGQNCEIVDNYQDCNTTSDMNPLSLTFLFFYLILVCIQSLGMLFHRWETFIIYCSHESLRQFWRNSISCCDTANRESGCKVNLGRYTEEFEETYEISLMEKEEERIKEEEEGRRKKEEEEHLWGAKGTRHKNRDTVYVFRPSVQNH